MSETEGNDQNQPASPQSLPPLQTPEPAPQGAPTPAPTGAGPVGQPQAPEGPPPVNQELVEKLFTIKMLVKIDTLLQSCLIPGAAAADIQIAREFLKSMHEPLIKECQAHPDFKRATAPPIPQPSPEQLAEEALMAKIQAKNEETAKSKAEAKRAKKKTLKEKIFLGRSN